MNNVPLPETGYHRSDPDRETCPNCKSQNVKEVKFAWWGGATGPKSLNLYKCNDCKVSFNAKTREFANTGETRTKIIVSAIIAAIFIGIRLATLKR